MATFINTIKNIKTPKEITWTEYNALSDQLKNDGTQYYITDKNDAFLTASNITILNSQNNDSNVQTELNNIYNDIDELITGDQIAKNTQYLKSAHSHGLMTDDYGSFIKKIPFNTNGFWHIDNADGTKRICDVYWQTGALKTGSSQANTFCWGIGDTSTAGTYFLTGVIDTPPSTTNNGLASSRLRFNIPMITAGTAARMKSFDLIIRHVKGGYAYMKYGTDGASIIALGSTAATIWKDYAQNYTNSINSLSVTVRNGGYLYVQILFAYSLASNSAGTTNLTAGTPVSIQCTPVITFS